MVFAPDAGLNAVLKYIRLLRTATADWLAGSATCTHMMTTSGNELLRKKWGTGNAMPRGPELLEDSKMRNFRD